MPTNSSMATQAGCADLVADAPADAGGVVEHDARRNAADVEEHC